MSSLVSNKQILVNTFGGKCQLCGYNKCMRALAFHHRDPSKKDFQISAFKKKAVDTFVLARELEKCVLLCANCHAEVHDGMHVNEIEELPSVCVEDIM